MGAVLVSPQNTARYETPGTAGIRHDKDLDMPHDGGLLQASVIFLLAAVITVPLAKRLQLGAVLGYLLAGVIIGPQVLRLVDDPESVAHFSEMGVVLLLFIIGLEL